MKRTRFLLCALSLVALTAAASPIPKKQIAADAKWVVHLDAEQFLRGKVGAYLVEHVLNPRSAEMKARLKQDLGVDWDWNKLQSITAYGTGYRPQEDNTGLLLIRTTMDVKGALDAAMAKNIPQLRIEKLADAALPLYRFNDQGYLGLREDGLVLMGRHRAAIDRGLEVLGGRAKNIEGATAFQEYPETSSGFFLLAVAEGFGQQADLPASAAIFKQATGARLVLGEDNDRLRLSLDLKSASADDSLRIQQVAQGLLALATMNASQNPDLQKLTRAAAVTGAGKCVTLALAVPVADVIAKISENQPAP